jgi:nicotinamidase-related amidase
VEEAIALQDIDAMVGRVDNFAAALRGRAPQVWVNHAILAAMTNRGLADHGAAAGFIGMLADMWRLWTRRADDIARDEMYRIEPAAGDAVIGKTEYDAFAGTRLDGVLRAAGADTLVLSGVFRDVCVLETAKAARRRGYAVYVAEDLT